MARMIDITGVRFHRLIVVKFHTHRGKKRVWECICDCGNKSFAQVCDLTSGKHKSCGCLQIEKVTKHGMANSREYTTWQSMCERCKNPLSTGWKWYGGRGIKVCDGWNQFDNFYEDMGERPIGMSLDRIDNDGDYTPDNCKWSTRKEQAKNQRKRQATMPRRIPNHSGSIRDPITGRYI